MSVSCWKDYIVKQSASHSHVLYVSAEVLQKGFSALPILNQARIQIDSVEKSGADIWQ